MLKISEPGTEGINQNSYGGKAVGLDLLYEHNLLIPDTLFIEAVNDTKCLDACFFQSLEKKLAPFEKNGLYSVAIRSSATLEDSVKGSMAGHFKSFLGTMSFDEACQAVRDVAASLYALADANMDPDAKMGVIVQKYLEGSVSGITQSSDPVTFRKDRMLSSLVCGSGVYLAEGSENGTDICTEIKKDVYESDIISEEKQTDRQSGKYNEYLKCLHMLCPAVKELERELGFPIEVEWTFKDGKIYYLQCRPLTGITKWCSGYYRIGEPGWEEHCGSFLNQEFMELWNVVLREKIEHPNTWVLIDNYSEKMLPDSSSLLKTSKERGYSVVMQYPQDVFEKNACTLVGDRTKVFGEVTNCCRYGIRSFPEYDGYNACIDSYRKKASGRYWLSAIIVQEVYDPLYTGAIRQVEDGYLIEITRGKLLTKGGMQVSQYVLDRDGRLLYKEEIEQKEWYTILEGHILYCTCTDEKKIRVSLPLCYLQSIISEYRPLLNLGAGAIEFCVLYGEDNGAGNLCFIDLICEGSSEKIGLEEAMSGVISRGKAEGKIRYVDDGQTDAERLTEDCILFCRRPVMTLLPLIKEAEKQQLKIGFVFKEASICCHFSMLLREKNIPAIKIGSYSHSDFPEGKSCLLDAIAGQPDVRKRLRIMPEK